MRKKYILTMTEVSTRTIKVIVEASNRNKAKSVFRQAVKHKGRSDEDHQNWSDIMATARLYTAQQRYKNFSAKWDKNRKGIGAEEEVNEGN